MQRSKLRNIINKSKLVKSGESSFESFKNSLPKEFIDDNYRLEAAWKAYGSPKSYKEAIGGLIQPIDENTVRLPSIGYNTETEEYEYLNKGKDNEIVSKDITAWDNDVIPLIKELKQGGYVRTFNEEKDCWTYSKNVLKRENSSLTDELQISLFQKGGKQADGEAIRAPQSLPRDLVRLVYNSNANFAKRLTDKNRKSLKLSDGQIGNFKLSYVTAGNKAYVFPQIQELDGQLVDLSQDGQKAWNSAFLNKDYIEFPSIEDADWFTADNYKAYFPGLEQYAPQAFKQGGQMNVIPEGALHARKNNMDGAGEDFTAKGIPVMSKEGEQIAEIEKEEWTMSKELTDDVESWYKKFYDDNTSLKDKDELAIKCGKRITKELLHNTDDRANLIAKILEDEE